MNAVPMNVPMNEPEVRYFPQLFSAEASDGLFEALREQIAWRQEKITLYGRQHDQPRLIAWYGDPAHRYTYSGLELQPMPWIDPLLQIRHRVEQLSDATFNSVLLNLYRNGSDSVAWHADDELELGRNPVIASVSFGQSRVFRMKHKRTKEGRQLLLEHGSCLLMSGTTQHCWLHQIAKSKRPMGARINLTFRKIIGV